MIKRSIAIASLALMMAPAMTSAASARDLVESRVGERVECLFRVYVNEGGEGGLDCLS